MPCRCIIVDNELVAARVLKKYIQVVPQLELEGTCKNALEALKLLSKRKVDLIFLDIQVPEMMGSELLKTLSHSAKIIFTTSNKDFAVEAFELDAIDYLLKPIAFERFLRAVNKFLQKSYSLPELKQSNIGYVYFRSDRKMIKVFLNEVLFIESFKDYVIIHLEFNKELKFKITLNHVEDMLPPSQFLRIHRSYIVSVNKITAFTKTDVEIGKTELPIGTSYTNIFSKLTSNQNDFPDGIIER